MNKEFKKNDVVRINPTFIDLADPEMAHNPRSFCFIFNVKGDTCTLYSNRTRAVGGSYRVYRKNIKLDWIVDANKEYNEWVHRLNNPWG
jgi:hypothetical protein